MAVDSESPLISVIMPAYNTEKYIKQAIESILSQTFTDFEFLILDDGSSDRTPEIITEFSKKDERIIFIRSLLNKGYITRLNEGLQLAKGKYIARMDSDDICTNRRIEEQVKLIKETNADICSCNVLYIDKNEIYIAERKYNSDIKKTIFKESPICHATVLIKKELFTRYGNYNKTLTGTEDYELWIRFWMNRCQFVNHPDFFYKYRLHSEGTKARQTKKTLINILKIKFRVMYRHKIFFKPDEWLRLLGEIILILLPASLVYLLFEKQLKIKNSKG